MDSTLWKTGQYGNCESFAICGVEHNLQGLVCFHLLPKYKYKLTIMCCLLIGLVDVFFIPYIQINLKENHECDFRIDILAYTYLAISICFILNAMFNIYFWAKYNRIVWTTLDSFVFDGGMISYELIVVITGILHLIYDIVEDGSCHVANPIMFKFLLLKFVVICGFVGLYIGAYTILLALSMLWCMTIDVCDILSCGAYTCSGLCNECMREFSGYVTHKSEYVPINRNPAGRLANDAFLEDAV